MFIVREKKSIFVTFYGEPDGTQFSTCQFKF